MDEARKGRGAGFGVGKMMGTDTFQVLGRRKMGELGLGG